MHALVTGGAGFIGSHVVRTLIEEGVEVRVLHLPRENLRNLDGLECEKMAGDILDPACCARAVRDALVWFARNGKITDTRVARRLFEISSS